MTDDALLKILFALGGAWNTFFAVRALLRGCDRWMFIQRIDRNQAPFAFWFYSIFCRGVSGLGLLALAFFYF
jgi:lipid-A-disaccharide synthase-like uncharacterized protein